MDTRFDGVVSDVGDRLEALLPVLYEPDSHAASLVELDNGDLLCAWFNGPGEGEPDTNVVLSRLAHGSRVWSKPQLMASDPARSEQNPVLTLSPAGEVWLLHTSNEPHDQSSSRVLLRRSADHGYTWTDAEVLFAEPGTFLRNHPITLADGTWLLPAYHCRPGREHSAVKASHDGGHTWTEHDLPDSDHRVQMSVVERDDGTVFAVFRSRWADRIYTSESADGGRTWRSIERTALPNNNSAIEMTKLRSGRIALVYNDATLERDQFRWVGSSDSPRKKAVRTPLTIALSEDGGTTWPYHRNVQMADLEYRGNEMGYSYPTIIQGRDDRIHVAFSYLRKTIKHVQLDEGWVVKGSR